MPYNLSLTVFTHAKKLCSRLSLCEVRFYTEDGRFAFLSHPLGDRANVQWSSYTHWKVRSELPISVNWTFFARCYL